MDCVMNFVFKGARDSKTSAEAPQLLFKKFLPIASLSLLLWYTIHHDDDDAE